MMVVKVRPDYQLTIPQAFLRKIKLAAGDFVEIEISGETLVIRPAKDIPPEQEHFFSAEWQKKEAEADGDIAEGRVIGPFHNVADALEALKGAKV